MAGLCCAALIFFSAAAHAQIGCPSFWQSTGGPYLHLDRTNQLAKRAPISIEAVDRSGWAVVQNCSSLTTQEDSVKRFSGSLLPAGLVIQNNSAYPRTQQDGLRWAGRGISGSAAAGAAGRWGPVTAALVPVISYQQNEDLAFLPMAIPGLSRYSSYNHVGMIDMPQRFGSDSFYWMDPGQSFVRADAYGFTAGFSTENMRWGPARMNPILMSGAGVGFPHFFAGTGAPLDLRIAHLDLQAVWGHLAESDYFDSLSLNDKRLFAGFVATLTPKNSGLTIGVARAYLRTIPREGLSLSEQIFGPYTGISENPADSIQGDNQLVSIFLTWALPEVGFEAYGEYAREDHWEDSNDLLMELDHSRGYTVGFEKVFTLRGGPDLLSVWGEATNLGNAPTFQSGRPGATFYEHAQVRQGYTHRGQLLGAPIGPGSDAQYIAADYLGSPWQGGLYYNRVRYDNDAYYRNFGFRHSNRGHDTEWTLGVRGSRSVRNVQLVFDLAYSRRYNRGFVVLLNTEQYENDDNISITLGGSWIPPALRNDQ